MEETKVGSNNYFEGSLMFSETWLKKQLAAFYLI